MHAYGDMPSLHCAAPFCLVREVFVMKSALTDLSNYVQ